MQNYISHHPLVLVPFLPFLFAAFWCSIVFVISRISGWSLLARRFRLEFPFTATTWRWQSARMRWLANYNNCLTVGSDPSGLCLSPFFLFRTGHPPLLVPWPEISIYRRRKVVFVTLVELRLGREEQIPFTITETLAERLRGAAGAGWPSEPIC